MLTRTLQQLESVSQANQDILRDFSQHYLSKDLRSEYHIVSLLKLLISLDRFYNLPFTSINKKDQILKFLSYRQVNGKWIEREKDAEGKYISSFNFYLGLLKIFFRWLVNKTKNEDEWETPSFLKIKNKKPLRDSPYTVNEIWTQDELLTIVEYEPELRNKAIITLLWDLDARPHEVTALRIRDIVLDEQYGEGTIPSNTKTGGGPILLTSSFTYVRDWINKHPFKNEPNARLICNLYTGAPVRPQVIFCVFTQLRQRIKRLVEGDHKQKQKLEYLLRTKKWNPYCIRHSAITDDSNHLPEYAVKKKARWTMNSQQGKRYIKNTLGEELKNKILERSGIRLVSKQVKMVSRVCGKCGYVNNLSNKYCENLEKGCSYPLTQEALDEIKAAEQLRVSQLVKESNLDRDNTIIELQNCLKTYDDKIEQFGEKFRTFIDRHKKEERDRKRYLDSLIKERDWYISKYGVSEPFRKRIEELQKQISTLPEDDEKVD